MTPSPPACDAQPTCRTCPRPKLASPRTPSPPYRPSFTHHVLPVPLPLQLFPTRLGEKLSPLTAGTQAEVVLEPGAVLRQGSALRQCEEGRVEVVLGAGNQVPAPALPCWSTSSAVMSSCALLGAESCPPCPPCHPPPPAPPHPHTPQGCLRIKHT